MFPIYQVVFWVFAAVLVAGAVMVITARNPVRAVLFLIVCFFASSVLWMLLEAEFLALVLIFLYVGAVMTLFLFVVMMLNIDLSRAQEHFVRYLPVGLVATVLLVIVTVITVNSHHLPIANMHFETFGPNYNNTQALGTLLYTHYLWPFEIAGLILLVAIIGAISLVFHGKNPDAKSQNVAEQHKANKKDRLRIIKMKAEKP